VDEHDRTTLVAGLPLFWRELGAGEPLVLVHGLGVSGRYLLPTARLLARTQRVLVPDLPGFGRSPGPPGALGIGGLAAALAAWLDAIEVAHASFLGNSMGCQTLIRLAVEEPERVRRLVAVGPTMDRRHRTAAQQLARLVAVTPYERLGLVPLVAFEYGSRPLRTLRTLAHALRDRPEEQAPNVRAPTLLVRGEHDAIAPQAWLDELAAALPSARVAVVPGTGHAVNYSAPGRLAELTLEFLAEHES
jgi:pimeloyl-ACP methyl ester carboxylesterase